MALNVSGPGPVHPPLSGDVFDAAVANVTRWVEAEAVKAATAKSKNDLEAYIISTREKLETNEQFQEVGVQAKWGAGGAREQIVQPKSKYTASCCSCRMGG